MQSMHGKVTRIKGVPFGPKLVTLFLALPLFLNLKREIKFKFLTNCKLRFDLLQFHFLLFSTMTPFQGRFCFYLLCKSNHEKKILYLLILNHKISPQ